MRQHYFRKIRGKYKNKAGNKNSKALINSMNDKCGGCREPENKNGGIKRIHQETRNDNFDVIPFSKFKNLFSPFINFYFFKEQEINTNTDQEQASHNSYDLPVLIYTGKQFGKYIAYQNKCNIADGYANYKCQATAVAII